MQKWEEEVWKRLCMQAVGDARENIMKSFSCLRRSTQFRKRNDCGQRQSYPCNGQLKRTELWAVPTASFPNIEWYYSKLHQYRLKESSLISSEDTWTFYICKQFERKVF